MQEGISPKAARHDQNTHSGRVDIQVIPSLGFAESQMLSLMVGSMSQLTELHAIAN